MEDKKNVAGKYASAILKSQSSMLDSKLNSDYDLLIGGHAIYIKGFSFAKDDFNPLKALMDELTAFEKKEKGDDFQGLITWSQHQKYVDAEQRSETCARIIQEMADYFDVTVYATRLNFYPDGTYWKPYHHDSHASRSYFHAGGQGKREDFTMGMSLGASRELSFIHVADTYGETSNKHTFSFPQDNGDVFAFDSKVNTAFQHGVPKTNSNRFSIIAWGRRNTLTKRNGGGDECGTRTGETELEEEEAHVPPLGEERENECGPPMIQVKTQVDSFISKKGKKPAKGRRRRNQRIK